MSRINLLPWREELREQRQKDFVQALGLVLLLAGFMVFVTGQWFSNEVSLQLNRNGYYTKEIKVLDKKISEIRQLRDKREQLLSRMKVIQDLQGNRPIPVRVFDELAKTLGDGVFYKSLTVQQTTITINGVAESNNRVSNLMRKFDESPWFATPNLTGIRSVSGRGGFNTDVDAKSFQLSVVRTTPKKSGAK